MTKKKEVKHVPFGTKLDAACVDTGKRRWRNGTRLKADPIKVADEAERLETDGVVLPEALFAYAQKHKRSELHKCFTWDKNKAAKDRNLDEARYVLRSLVIIVEYTSVGKEHPVQIEYMKYSNLRADTPGRGPYIATGKVMRDPVMRQVFLQDAIRRLKQWRDRYQGLVELSHIYEIIDSL